MATIVERRHDSALMPECLRKNLFLLGLHYKMNLETKAVLKDTKYEKLSRISFFQISYYLMTIIDSEFVSHQRSMHDMKETEYRETFVKFVLKTSSNNEGFISDIKPLMLVNTGSPKVLKLLMELSQVALKMHLTKMTKNTLKFDIKNMNTSEIVALTDNMKEALRENTYQWEIYLKNALEVKDVLNKKASTLEIEKNNIEKTFKSKIDEVENKIGVESLDELRNNLEDSQILKDWSMNLDEKINCPENEWLRTSNVVAMFKECEKKCAEVFRRCTTKCDDCIIYFDPVKDDYRLNSELEIELIPRDREAVKSIVKDGVLDFPSLFVAYAIVMRLVLKDVNLCVMTDYAPAVEKNNNVIVEMKGQLREIVAEIYSIRNQLKSEANCDFIPVERLPWLPSMLKVLKVPDMPTIQPTPQESNPEDFRQFFPGIRYKGSQYLTTQNRETYRSLIQNKQKNTMSSSKNLNRSFKSNKKPDYLKNMEEIRKNMARISINPNCTINRSVINSNVSTVSHLSRKDYMERYTTKTIDRYNRVSTVNNCDQSYINEYNRTTFGNSHVKQNHRKVLENMFIDSPDLVFSKNAGNSHVKDVHHKKATLNSNERLSGIESIEYSSFESEILSDTNASNERTSHILKEKLNILKMRNSEMERSVDKTVESKLMCDGGNMTISHSRRSVDQVIDKYNSFKNSRKTVASSALISTSEVTSFLENQAPVAKDRDEES